MRRFPSQNYHRKFLVLRISIIIHIMLLIIAYLVFHLFPIKSQSPGGCRVQKYISSIVLGEINSSEKVSHLYCLEELVYMEDMIGTSGRFRLCLENKSER